MDSQALPERVCPRCGAPVPRHGSQCPGCRLSLEPGVVFFEPESGTDPASRSEAIEPGSEQKVVSCLPTDVERLARSEAVDGWALRYTAVDEARAGHVKAVFGRPLQRVPRPDAGASTRAKTAAKPAPSTSTRVGAKGKAKGVAKGAPRPELGPEPHTDAGDFWRLISVLVAVGAIVLLAENFGLAGLVLGLIFVPGVVRSFLGGGHGR